MPKSSEEKFPPIQLVAPTALQIARLAMRSAQVAGLLPMRLVKECLCSNVFTCGTGIAALFGIAIKSSGRPTRTYIGWRSHESVPTLKKDVTVKQPNAKSNDGGSPGRSRTAGRRASGEPIDLPLDQASNDDDESGDEALGEDEKNLTGGALPASDDGDNDNDHEDVRERERLDHLRRNPAEDDA